MVILTYLQVLFIQFAILCCFGKYIVQSDVTIQTTSSQWNDLIQSSQLSFCTNEKSENYIGQAINSNQIQWKRSFNIEPLTSKVYIYLEYQISGEWNDDEVVIYVDNVKQSTEKISFIDTNKLCNEDFLFNSFMYVVYNMPQNTLDLQIRVGIYIKKQLLFNKHREEDLKHYKQCQTYGQDYNLSNYTYLQQW